jgi:hypothetical protein
VNDSLSDYKLTNAQFTNSGSVDSWRHRLSVGGSGDAYLSRGMSTRVAELQDVCVILIFHSLFRSTLGGTPSKCVGTEFISSWAQLLPIYNWIITLQRHSRQLRTGNFEDY